AGLDGIHPASLALAEFGCGQKIADRENPGQGRAHLMGKSSERGLDYAGNSVRSDVYSNPAFGFDLGCRLRLCPGLCSGLCLGAMARLARRSALARRLLLAAP